jgi:hypothetical protein
MAFKRCEKVRYVDSVSKENEEDSELMKTVSWQKIVTNWATAELATDAAAIASASDTGKKQKAR